jgi:hypothetical protein
MWMKTQLKKKENPIEDDLVLDLAHPQLSCPIVQTVQIKIDHV